MLFEWINVSIFNFDDFLHFFVKLEHKSKVVDLCFYLADDLLVDKVYFWWIWLSTLFLLFFFTLLVRVEESSRTTSFTSYLLILELLPLLWCFRGLLQTLNLAHLQVFALGLCFCGLSIGGGKSRAGHGELIHLFKGDWFITAISAYWVGLGQVVADVRFLNFYYFRLNLLACCSFFPDLPKGKQLFDGHSVLDIFS